MNDYFSRDTREDRKAAFRAARDAAAGRGRDEVRALYLAELRARDVGQPPDDYLEMDVTRIINASVWKAGQGSAAQPQPLSGPGPIDRLLMPARAIRSAAKIREHLLPQYRPGHETKYIYPDRSAEAIQVVLEPGAGQWLTSGQHLPRGADPATRVDVWLDFAAAITGDRLVRVHVRDYFVGVLPPEGADQFRAELEDAERGGYFLMTSGFIARDEGSTCFCVYRFASD